MEILEANHRRIVLIAIIVVALVVSVLLGFTFMSRPKTPFEREQAIAEASNPRWLKVEIATRDGRRQYRDNESIFVVVHFSSAARYMYKADAADGVDRAAGSDILHISDGEMKPRNMMGKYAVMRSLSASMTNHLYRRRRPR